MRVVVKLVGWAWICFVFACFAEAQIASPIVALPLDGDPQPTQLTPYATWSSPQCDSNGVAYVSYASQGGFSASSVARIEADGTTQNITLDPLPGSQTHTYLFAPGSDGSLYEILRAPASGDPARAQASTEVDYASFDADGNLRSDSLFAEEFIPSMLVPFPSGNFFAAGVSLKLADDGVSESGLAGIFRADGRLLSQLKDVSGRQFASDAGDDAGNTTDAVVQGNTARLGNDGNVYVLLGQDQAQIAVIAQDGRIVRNLKLREPFENGVASDMWVSGNRLLVEYEGEASDPKDLFIYVLYDAYSGEVIRAYKPEFSGTPACFGDGHTLSVFVHQASGRVAIAVAQLQ